jgi:hypothetical protein
MNAEVLAARFVRGSVEQTVYTSNLPTSRWLTQTTVN